MTIVFAILGCAALFVLFGVTRPPERCEHRCDGCALQCGSRLPPSGTPS